MGPGIKQRWPVRNPFAKSSTGQSPGTADFTVILAGNSPQQVARVVPLPRCSLCEFTGAEKLRCISSTCPLQVLVAPYRHCEETGGLKIFAGCSVRLRALHCIALHSASLYSREESSTITSVPLWQPDEAWTGRTRAETPPPPQSQSRFSYLWHGGGYILFAARAPEVWEPPRPVTPRFCPPTPLSATHRRCNLCWHRPQLTKSTTRSFRNMNA